MDHYHRRTRNIHYPYGVSTPGSGGNTILGDIFIDSVNGNDTNTGASASNAKKTLSSIVYENGMIIQIAKGSYFRESLGETAVGITNVTVNTYGSGKLPIFDCADIITSEWTQVDGTTNVWETTINNPNDLDQNFVSVWENGNRLFPVQDTATCDSDVGSFCTVNTSNASYTGTSTVLRIHTSNSDDPNTNGMTYEVPMRASGVVARSGWVVNNLHTKRNGHNNGSLVLTDDATANNCLAEDGVKHNIYAETNCTLTDCIAWKADYPVPYRDGWTGFVAFDLDASGKTAEFTRCISIVDLEVLNWNNSNGGAGLTGFYSHSDGGAGHNWNSITYTDCAAQYCYPAFSSSDVDTLNIIRPRIEGCKLGIQLGSATSNITDPWIYQTQGVQLQRGISKAGTGVTNLNGARIWASTSDNDGYIFNQGSDTFNIDGSVFTRGSGAPDGYQYFIRSGSSSHISVTNSIIYGPNTGFGECGISRYNVDLTNDNVYGNLSLDMEVDGVSYSSIADYLSAGTGFDANSITVTTNPFVDAANGDFNVTQESGIGTFAGLERPNITYITIPTSTQLENM